MAISGITDEMREYFAEKKDIKSSFKPFTKFEIPEEEVDAKYFSSDILLDKAIEDLKNTKAKDFISYGYKFLDNHLGGIYKGDLIIVGGETGTGKTLFSNNIAIKASKKYKVAVWSLEDDPRAILKQRVYNRINEYRVREGKSRYPFIAFWRNEIDNMEFWRLRKQAYEEIKKEIGSNLIYIDPQQTPTIELLEREIERLSDIGVELMLIDHLHKFNFRHQGSGSKADMIEEFMNRLRRVQDKTGMRVILIVHYTKLNGAKPILDSFKDSIAIPQNASVVINLWRDRGNSDNEENKTNETLIMLPKIRIPVPEITFTAEFDPEINDYKDDDFVFGTEQGDKYKEFKEQEKKKSLKNKLN